MDNRKELKQAYKQTPRPMGVYKIANQANGKIFVAGSMNIPAKFNSHRFQLGFKCHLIKELQADWDQHGPDAFSFEILETIKADTIPPDQWRKTVKALEEKWLDRLRPYDRQGYNTPQKTPAGHAAVSQAASADNRS